MEEKNENTGNEKWWWKLSDDENFSATMSFGIRHEEVFQEECIILDQQNLAEEIQELYTGTPEGNSNIPLNGEKLRGNISEKFSSKKTRDSFQ